MMYMQDGKTALHRAQSAEIAKVLIDNGVKVDKTDMVCGSVAFVYMGAWEKGWTESCVCEDGASGDEGGFAKG